MIQNNINKITIISSDKDLMQLIKDKNDKLLCMNSVVHAADISNPIKEWSISFGWTQVVMEEFWSQVLHIYYIS